MFAHIPGLRVVIPSSPSRAYGLMLGAIADPDPVVFLEPKRLYHAFKEEVEDDGQALPLTGNFVLRDGDDVTLISWGAMILETLEAAAALSEQGVSAEVIDVGVLSPFNDKEILASVCKTGRCVIVHEAALTGGFGAEIAARVADKAIMSLIAPIKRVAGPNTVMPLPRLEGHYMPSVQSILEAADECLSHA